MSLQAWLFVCLLILVTGVVSIKLYMEHLYYCLKSKIHKCDKQSKFIYFHIILAIIYFKERQRRQWKEKKTTSLDTWSERSKDREHEPIRFTLKVKREKNWVDLSQKSHIKKNINHIDQSANLINPHLDLDKTKDTFKFPFGFWHNSVYTG